MTLWDRLPRHHYVALAPWCWVQLESADAPGPFPFVAGVAPDVAGSLTEAHSLLASAIDTAISDVFSKRAPVDDPDRQRRLEDAYAELVNARPYLSRHITCGRNPDGTFRWEFPTDPTRSSTVTNGGLRIFHSVKRQAIPLGFDQRPLGPMVGTLLGMLDGTRQTDEIRTVLETAPREARTALTRLMELLIQHECLLNSPRISIRPHWLKSIQDRDMVHLGHAALLYRQLDNFFLFDPWLLPWFAESSLPSLWGSLLPKPSAVFLTHDHDDHVDPRTLLHLPKDTPIIVPSRRNRKIFYYDYLPLLRELGFGRVVELAHGESWPFEGGTIISVPFYGEDPCDLQMPRNCYLISDRGYNILVHADSGPANDGQSPLKDGVIAQLAGKYGPIPLVFASQQQLLELRSHAAHAPLSHPGKWLEVGENGYLTNAYLSDLCRAAQAALFVSYATGGADWYPDHLSFMFSRRNPARTALLTARWERPETLKDLLSLHNCGYHCSRALDLYRSTSDARIEVVSTGDALTPLSLHRLDHGDPPFMTTGRHV
ncbi:MAG: MBL fold metallo-hydrolase [Nitrospiraceae bacterium]|jgi:L-ascorbate metabolism protein UlaG (beta-lactamase superfamily)|uniref:MBL fold metallo-hydrolase n=1 Tax=Nitrospira cf. moscoviensis SBR1015 TaxID=96242 RepID=UPI00112493BA|nr:MBL fold metallo-hydrolase [Nitrospira cf. moscoviensis SBR1015]MBY0246341.1 MBL fold metallo-hydrolase [Nitrospiraceae bacterium]